ncbi:MAG: HAD family hydrolase [Deltaproteobacteria bacterium]|nr:HAD family hydrolase [Deltaproteobacteria bacterium]
MKLAIFDFEGTLVDFQWQLAAAQEEVRGLLEGWLDRAGLDRQELAGLDYCRLYNHLQRRLTDPNLRAEIVGRVAAVYDRYDADAAGRWRLYPGVGELLTALRERGWGLALDSNVGRRALDQMLARFSLASLFDVTVSRNEVTLLKPAAEGLDLIRAYYRQREVAVDRAFMVGDSVTDIETARQAGIPVIILKHGEDRTSRLRRHAPDYLVDRFAEVGKILLAE